MCANSSLRMRWVVLCPCTWEGLGALREFLLPDLLTFQKSAAVPCNFERNHLRVSNDGRHLFLSGEGLVVANAQEDGFTLVCPVKTDGTALAWCVVDSEAQGFARLPHDMGAFAGGAKLSRIELRNVFFRGDELLGEANLAAQTMNVQMALGVIFKDLLCHQQT